MTAHNTPQHQTLSSGDPFADIRKILFKYLSHWIWFVLSILIFSTAGVAYIKTLVPQYSVAASILIKDSKKTGGSAIPFLEELDLFSNTKTVENEIEILRSYTLLEEVVDDLNLQVRYAVEDRWRMKQVYENLPVRMEIVAAADKLFLQPFTLYFDGQRVSLNGKTYPSNALITESFGSIRITVNDSLTKKWNKTQPIIVSFIPKIQAVEALRGSLQVASADRNTSVITLSILSPVPQLGKDILNHLIAVYNKAAIADKNNLANITLKFIDERLNLVGKDLQEVEQNVEEYKTEKGITDIGAESSLFLHTIQQNDAELSKVRIQLDILHQIEQFVLSSEGGTAPATLGLSDPTLLSLIGSLTAAEAERTGLLSTLQPANPKIQAIDDQIKTLKGKIIDNINVLRRSLESMRNNLKVESRRIESIIQSIPKKERELVDITRQREIVNQLYIYLLSKREETAISHAATVADSRIVNAARSTLGPVQPQKRNILLIFGLVGLLLPAGIIWLIDLFNTKISVKSELEKQMKAPIAGEVSLVKKSSKILITSNKRSKHAEQIHTLRTNLEFMHAGGVKVILVTSSIGSEGKSFISANLAVAFATLGKKTALLGFDLRKPELHKIFGINNEKGLSNYLAGQTEFEKIVKPIEMYNNLNIITCGHITPNPQELLQNEILTGLFERLRKEYEYVIVDTPPAGLVSDALILNRFADIAIYVVRYKYTPKECIKFINNLYTSNRLKNFGVVINGIRDEKWSGYGYGAYSHYGKYYVDEK
jgi:capsular exopolysaccharide synthesis family protein